MKKILVVEDDKHLRDIMETALSEEGYEVILAEDGQAGYDTALEIFPDMVICDITMPKHDGYWVLENLKKHSKFNTMPFIFLTAKVEREDIRKGMNLGADDYITKPFKVVELLNAIESRFAKKEHLISSITRTQKTSLDQKVQKDALILLDTGKRLERIKIDNIECILAESVYTKIYLTDKIFFIVRKTLNEWENILPEKLFLRIHRSYIINLEHIKKNEKWYNQTLLIYLQNYEQSLTVSRKYSAIMKKKLVV